MSNARPPRPAPRAPFPHAQDYVAPVIDIEEDDGAPPTHRTGAPVAPPPEEEPFPLHSEYVPTIRDVSEQIAAQSRHIVTLHRETALMHHQVHAIDGKVDGLTADLRELRGLVTTDHAPRITAVEKRAPITLPPAAAKAGKLTAIGLAVPLVLQGLAAIRPDLQGPIELIAKLFGGG